MSSPRFTAPPRQTTGPGGLSRRGFLRGSAAALAAPALAGSATALLAGCGGGGGGNELTFWNHVGPTGDQNPQSQWFVSMVEDWNKNNDVKVRLRYLPVSEYLAGTALQTAFQSGEGPDIFLISPGDFLRYYNGGVLQDLTPHLSEQVRADYLPGVLDTRMVDGNVYGLPMETEPLAMYYDVKAFEQARLSEGDLPETWDDLLSVADRLTNDKRFGVLFETIPGYYQNFTWYPFMWMGGAAAVQDGRSAFASSGTVAALQLWQDTIATGVAPRKPQGDGAANASANLASGFCAMQQTGIWAAADLDQEHKGFEYGVFRLPTPPGGDYTTDLGGWAFVANAQGKNPEAAAKFVTWALGSSDAECVERSRQWSTVVDSNMPTRRSVQQAATRHGAFSDGVMAKFANEIAPGGRVEPRYTPEIYQAISDALQACQLGGEDPAQAAAEADDTIDGFLQTYQGAPII